MAAGDPIYSSNIVADAFFEQEGKSVEEGPIGEWDEGVRVWLTHPGTARTTSAWPKIGDAHPGAPNMFIVKVSDRKTESGMVEITAMYRGILRVASSAPTKPALFQKGTSTQIFSASGGGAVTYNVPVPIPTLTRVYLTLTAPDYEDVGATSAESFLPSVPSFPYSISGLESVTVNIITGWTLATRDWDYVIDDEGNEAAWLVTERYEYKYLLAL